MWTSPSALLLPLVMAWITTSVTRVLARFVPPPPAAAVAHSKHFVYANGVSAVKCSLFVELRLLLLNIVEFFSSILRNVATCHWLFPVSNYIRQSDYFLLK